MPSPQCIDLRKYADTYRVLHENDNRRAYERDDPWDLILPGQSGFVAPWGGQNLVACTRSVTTTRRVLVAVPDAIVVQNGTDGQNIIFNFVHLNVIAPLLRLRKRRKLTDQQRRAAIERMRAYAFPAKSQPVNPSTLSDNTGGVKVS